MISKIELKNFRSHKNTTIELSPNVNIICGDNDLGKSTILRALNWIAYNKPSGDSFISHGENDSKVSIELDNKYQIQRIKDKKKNGENSYTLFEDNSLINEFKAVGQNVPEEIKSYLKIDEINIQNQQDKTFLLSQSSGQISKYLNNIIGLELIDESIKNASSSIRQLTSEIKRDETRLSELKEEINNFSNIEELESIYSNVEQNTLQLNTIDQEIICLTKAIENIDKIEKIIYNINYSKELEIAFNNILNTIKYCSEIVVEQAKIESSLYSLNDYNSILELCNVEKAEKYLLELEKNNQRVNNCNKDYYNLNRMTIKLIKLKESIGDYQRDIIKYNKQLKKQIGNICPLCNQKIQGDLF